MTATLTPATPAVTVSSVHKPPAVAAIIGGIVGVLTMVQAFFTSGHLPSSAEVASILAGAGLALGSVGAYIGHHLGWLKAVGPAIAAAEPGLAAVAGQVPGLDARLATVEHAVQAQVDKVAPAVDVAALAEQVKHLILGQAIPPAGGQPTAAVTSAAPAAPAGA